MARRLRDYSSSNLAVNDRDLKACGYVRDYPAGPNFSHQVVRGILRGIFEYYSVPARRKKAENFQLDALEHCLLAHLSQVHGEKGIATSKGRYRNDDVNQISNAVKNVFHHFAVHPSPATLAGEANWLNEALAEYGVQRGRDSTEGKEVWIRANLPSILRGLNVHSACPRIDCPRRTSMPRASDIKHWAEINSIARLRNNILAHFHASTMDTVKRQLAKCSEV